MDPLKQVLMSSTKAFVEGGPDNFLDPMGRINVHGLRPYVDVDGRSKVAIIANDGKVGTIVTNAPAALRYDEWKDIDRTVLENAQPRLIGVSDLISRGLTHNLGSIGKVISMWERVSDMTAANIDMDAVTAGEEDLPVYDNVQVPVPIIHKDFRINARHLAGSRIFGEGLDVTAAAAAGRSVAEKSEEMLFGGAAINVDGATIYGYTTHPDRNQVDMAVAWSSIAQADNDDIIADVQMMLAAARADGHFGPFAMYIPSAYETKMDEDYRANDQRTVRQRIMSLTGIDEIKVADKLAANNVILVELNRGTVDMAIAQNMSTIQWQVMGGMQTRFKVMAVWVPRLKSDFNSKMGLVHLWMIP